MERGRIKMKFEGGPARGWIEANTLSAEERGKRGRKISRAVTVDCIEINRLLKIAARRDSFQETENSFNRLASVLPMNAFLAGRKLGPKNRERLVLALQKLKGSIDIVIKSFNPSASRSPKSEPL